MSLAPHTVRTFLKCWLTALNSDGSFGHLSKIPLCIGSCLFPPVLHVLVPLFCAATSQANPNKNIIKAAWKSDLIRIIHNDGSSCRSCDKFFFVGKQLGCTWFFCSRQTMMLNHLRGTHEENPEPYKKYNKNKKDFLGNGCASNIHFNWPVPSVMVSGAPDFCWDFWAGAGSSEFSLLLPLLLLLLLLLLPAPALEPPPNPHLSFPSWLFLWKKSVSFPRKKIG